MFIVSATLFILLFPGWASAATVTYTPPAPPDWQATAGGHIAQTSGFAVTVTSDKVSFTGGEYQLKVFGGTYDATGDLLVEQIGTHQTVQPVVAGNVITYPSAEVFDNGSASWKFWTKNDGFGKELIFDSTAGNVIDTSYDCLLIGGYNFDSTGELRFYSSAEDVTGTPLIKGDVVDAWRIGWVNDAGKLTQWFDTPIGYKINDPFGKPAKTLYIDNGIFYLFEDWKDCVKFDPSVAYSEAARNKLYFNWVTSWVPTSNYSNEWSAGGSDNSGNKRLFFAANVSSIFSASNVYNAYISSVRFQGTCSTSSGTSSAHTMYLSASTWNPATLTWNNAPSTSGSALFNVQNSGNTIDITTSNSTYITYLNNCLRGALDWQTGICSASVATGYTWFAIPLSAITVTFTYTTSGFPLEPIYVMQNDNGKYVKFWRDNDYLWGRYSNVSAVFGSASFISSPTPFYHITSGADVAIAPVTATYVTDQNAGNTYIFKSPIPDNLKNKLFFASAVSSVTSGMFPWQSIGNNPVDNVSYTYAIDSAALATKTDINSATAFTATRIAAVSTDIASNLVAIKSVSDGVLTPVRVQINDVTAYGKTQTDGLAGRIAATTADTDGHFSSIVVDVSNVAGRVDQATNMISSKITDASNAIKQESQNLAIRKNIITRSAYATVDRSQTNPLTKMDNTDLILSAGTICIIQNTILVGNVTEANSIYCIQRYPTEVSGEARAIILPVTNYDTIEAFVNSVPAYSGKIEVAK